MERIKLTTRTGGLVAYATVLPMVPPAEAVVWGERFFIRALGLPAQGVRADRDATEANMQVYVEGLLVPAQEVSDIPTVDRDPLGEAEKVA